MTQKPVYEHYMKADERPPISKELLLTKLVGTWLNTNPNSNYLARLLLSERDKRLILRAYGANEPHPIDWGEVEAIAYAGSNLSVAAGFHAFYPLNGNKINLWAYSALGVLVIQIYVSYQDDSHRSSHFSREFFRLTS
ncbi:hypothetical protein [Gloeothece verrucosa]|uniref:Uncharacterized protein n=1 Tax=Gloeothece verrucosa (strain PCC 7822) TaxID=497965 RepID=E0UKY2_GLOV7|nr:hypothetical protein [Gloeothece verrucosa]ADN17612.1 hypothetical protein Cyan7822_5751 [Gloeothece verrucosa PCC 7822]